MTSLAALILATSVLVLIPGPNAALIVANSLRYGLAVGVYTVIGTTVGVGLQLLLVVAGMAAVIDVAADALLWIRWAGVAYLITLGVKTWREPAADLAGVVAAPAMFWRGLFLSLANPKTLLFNAAFIPQFVTDASLAQFSLVAALFLTVLFLGDIVWAVFANGAGVWLGRYASLRNRLTGGVLIAAGVGLALSRR